MIVDSIYSVWLISTRLCSAKALFLWCRSFMSIRQSQTFQLLTLLWALSCAVETQKVVYLEQLLLHCLVYVGNMLVSGGTCHRPLFSQSEDKWQSYRLHSDIWKYPETYIIRSLSLNSSNRSIYHRNYSLTRVYVIGISRRRNFIAYWITIYNRHRWCTCIESIVILHYCWVIWNDPSNIIMVVRGKNNSYSE